MEHIASALGMGQNDNRVGGGDSFVDRLSCSYTVLILGVFATVITTKQWLGEPPISCWCPAHFTRTHETFTNNVCFTKNTYYLPLSQEHIPQGEKGKEYISYYQWVSLVLVCQACLFYFPRVIWSMLNKKSGIAVSTVTDAAIECQKKLDSESRDKVMSYMVRHLGRYLTELSRRHLMSGNKVYAAYLVIIYGNSLSVCYIFIKLCYLTNVIGQLFWLNVFLSTDYHMYGIRVLEKILQGESWSTSDRFPRVALCDFSIRLLGNIHNYTVQCSLPVNLLNEKIYIFIWFWFVFVAFATIGSLFMWLIVFIYLPIQVNYVKTRLVTLDLMKHEPEKEVNRFVRNFLRRDGLFLIRLVAKNSSDMIAAELIGGLWEEYKKNKQTINTLHSVDGSESSFRKSFIPEVSDIDEEDRVLMSPGVLSLTALATASQANKKAGEKTERGMKEKEEKERQENHTTAKKRKG